VLGGSVFSVEGIHFKGRLALVTVCVWAEICRPKS
jgi:hypothetical protein